jgi:uncharacterized protein (TIGR00725 family)
MLIAVIGGDRPPDSAARDAEVVGRLLARNGCTVICGGRGGIMEAACRGAREEGGHTIGILPGTDPADANPFVEFPIVSGIGHARNSMVVLSAAAVIAVDGSYGTLSEIAYALTYGKPVVGLATWRFSDASGEDTRVQRATTPEQAVDMALAAARTCRTQ